MGTMEKSVDAPIHILDDRGTGGIAVYYGDERNDDGARGSKLVIAHYANLVLILFIICGLYPLYDVSIWLQGMGKNGCTGRMEILYSRML